MICRRLLLLIAIVSLAACQSGGGVHEVYRSVPEPVIQPLPPTPLPPTPQVAPPPTGPKTAAEISGAAVTSLMKKAQGYRSAGQPDRAAATLERALGIEPRNYFVWSALAQAYLDQKNYAQAESVASKSNSLARGNLYVALENWKTIAAAREAAGNSAGADEAQQRIQMVQTLLGSAGGG